MSELKDLSLEQIDLYGGTQARVQTTEDAIASYADEMERGAEFPPVTVFFDGADYWLADGFHRYLATKRIDAPTIRAEVHTGGRGDALRFALGANATNGVCRTNADKRNAVEIALEEWPEMANTVLAEICRVSNELVRKTRHEMVKANRIEAPVAVTGKDGRQYPAKIEREPRGKTERSSSDKAGSGGGGAPGKKGKGELQIPGGSSAEIEAEARSMIRNGEINPFELSTLSSATAHDYAESVINLLRSMKPEVKQRREGLERIRSWVEGELSGRRAETPVEAVSVS